MKKYLSLLLTLSLAATLAVSSGCTKKSNKPVTGLPAKTGTGASGATGTGTGAEQVPALPGSNQSPSGTPLSGNPFEQPSRAGLEGMTPDREALKNYTVYFEFDRSAVRQSEQPKVQAVAGVLKAQPDTKLQIEGHCDERGTEEYNRSLGERRALALREFLINLGIDGNRIYTVSFGEDKPAVQGHNEEAWSKNRRGEFILYRKP
ncbi:OmpA family protein [Fontisphaera persica]|uniref:OmpA family protein n=1 Tax=Fontisphaera persica TaxID=2974023 RepID=UPI0024BFC327|nr:OmpA family protein [Fontisphaera persica]WCJ59058.1 OmpA family protein [Fontisphaera persica]